MSEATTAKIRKEYSYFAFISYSRKDEKWAEWLQNRLENYRLPASLRKENVDLPAKIFPVFRDKTDLSGVEVEESLQRELESSKYLIVICSKNAGASEWVSKEVEYFISLGREDAILPFIIEEDGFVEDDCYPEALRGIKSDLLGISVAELGRQRAFLRVVSTLLELRYDQVVMREEKRRRNRQILAAVGALIVCVVTGAVVWYNIPHSKYYAAVTYQYEIPQGLYELSKKDRQGAYSSYRITRQRGLVVSLECVNSAGVVVEPMLSIGSDEVPMTTYQYDEKGQLISSDQRDVYGQLITHKVYSYHLEAHQIAVDFRTPSNGIQAMAMSADQALGNVIQMGNETRSQITRIIHMYDDSGYLIQATYQKDNLGTVSCDSNGVFGKKYTYTENGQIQRATNLDANGQEHNCAYGWAAMEYAYDDMGRVISLQYYDMEGNKVRSQDNVSMQTMTYDDHGNAVCLEIFDETGNPYLCEEGYAVRTCKYDDCGFITDMYQFGLEGQPVMGTENIHHWQYETDENGRILKTSFYDILEEPVYSKTYGYVSKVCVLDEQGRTIEQRTYGVDGEPLADREKAYYGMQMEYDVWGNVSQIVYLDAQGEPAPSIAGYTCLQQYFNETGSLIRVEYRDNTGDLIRAINHVAVEQAEYDVFGNITSEFYLDETENPCYSVDGNHRCEFTYENGNPTVIQYFDIYGEPVFGPNGYHEARMEYDAQGHVCRLAFYDCAGNLLKSSEGFAVSEIEYDEYGRVLETRQYDTHQQPIDGEDPWRSVAEYDDRGNKVRSQSYYVDGTYQKIGYTIYVYDEKDRQIGQRRYEMDGTPLRAENGAAEIVNTYDEAGNLIRKEWLGADGKPYGHEVVNYTNVKEYDYDVYGNQIQIRDYYRNAAGERQCLSVKVMEYDAYGNCVREEYRDGEGNLCCAKDGQLYAIHRMGYDSLGHIVWEEYYGVDGQPCLHDDKAFRYEKVFNDTGSCIEFRYYDVDGQLVRYEDGHTAGAWITYDEYRNIAKIELFDENEKVIAYTENEYDERGFLTRETLYDSNGGFIKDEVFFVSVREVQEESPAYEAGIRKGDVLLHYGSWGLFTREEDFGSYEWMKTEINKNTVQEKIVIVAHPSSTSMDFEFQKVELPAGNIGIAIGKGTVSSEVMAELEEAYIHWAISQE